MIWPRTPRPPDSRPSRESSLDRIELSRVRTRLFGLPLRAGTGGRRRRCALLAKREPPNVDDACSGGEMGRDGEYPQCPQWLSDDEANPKQYHALRPRHESNRSGISRRLGPRARITDQ